MKKCNNSGGWLIPCVIAKGIDSGKNLHPNYLCIQSTSPIFSSAGMPSVWLTWFHSLDFSLLSEPKHSLVVCTVMFSGKPEQKRRDVGHCWLVFPSGWLMQAVFIPGGLHGS